MAHLHTENGRPGLATPLAEGGAQPTAESLARIEARLDLLLDNVDAMRRRQEQLEELVDESMPILKEVMRVGGDRLQALDDKGYVALGKAMLDGLDNIVESYEPEDFRLLAENLVGILDVVRGLTQPEVLAIADEAADVLHGAGRIAPVTVVGAIRASREDEVQKGMAVLLEMLRQVGKVTAARGRGGTRRRARTGVSQGMDSRLADRLAPTRRAVRTTTAPAAAVPDDTEATNRVEKAAAELGGVALDGNGFLMDPNLWTRELAELVAAAEGVELTDEAWAMVLWVRDQWKESGSSPNIRAITKGMGVDTRDIYTLFPKAPGRTIARVAGIPKPAGCI